MGATEPQAFDAAGRPIMHELPRNFQGLSMICVRVLYALALTELRGNKLGLTKRSIRKILQNENDPVAGQWDWLFDNRVSMRDDDLILVRNAIRKIFEEYPFVVLRRGTYIDVPELPRKEGGKLPEVYLLNEGAIERWPCSAKVIMLLSTGIFETPISYKTLTRYMPQEHCSHFIPSELESAGAKRPQSHTLREDIEFLVRARYLRLFTHEKGDQRRQKITYKQPLSFDDDSLIELSARASWEQTYLQRLAKHFAETEKGLSVSTL